MTPETIAATAAIVFVAAAMLLLLLGTIHKIEERRARAGFCICEWTARSLYLCPDCVYHVEDYRRMAEREAARGG